MDQIRLDLKNPIQSFHERSEKLSVVSGNSDGSLQEEVFSFDGRKIYDVRFNSDGLPCIYHDDNYLVCSKDFSCCVIFKETGEIQNLGNCTPIRILSSTLYELEILVNFRDHSQGIITVRPNQSPSLYKLPRHDDFTVLDKFENSNLVRRRCGVHTGITWEEFEVGSEGIRGCSRAYRYLPDGSILGETHDLEFKGSDWNTTLALFKDGYINPLLGANGELISLSSEKKLAIFDDERVLTIAAVCRLEDLAIEVPLMWQIEDYLADGYGYLGRRLDAIFSSSQWFVGKESRVLLHSGTRLFQKGKSLVLDLTSVVR